MGVTGFYSVCERLWACASQRGQTWAFFFKKAKARAKAFWNQPASRPPQQQQHQRNLWWKMKALAELQRVSRRRGTWSKQSHGRDPRPLETSGEAPPLLYKGIWSWHRFTSVFARRTPIATYPRAGSLAGSEGERQTWFSSAHTLTVTVCQNLSHHETIMRLQQNVIQASLWVWSPHRLAHTVRSCNAELDWNYNRYATLLQSRACRALFLKSDTHPSITSVVGSFTIFTTEKYHW